MSEQPLGAVFDPTAPLAIGEHARPHWSQAGAILFITFRTADSIPAEVLCRWEREKHDWVRRQTGQNHPWRLGLQTLAAEQQQRFRKTFERQRENFLDSCHGACVLRRPQLAKIVADALLYFDQVRYRMGDFVVMPNHVHLLASFPSADALATQCDSWLHYTARQINQVLGRRGKFWQQEPFDHLVRSSEQYDYLRDYIQRNPAKARLKPGEYLYRRYPEVQR